MKKNKFEILFKVFLAFNLIFSLVIFEINAVEYVELKNLIQNKKTLKLGSKMSYLGILRPEFEKIHCRN